MALRMGLGYDIHAKADGRTLKLGGITFDGERGLAGHSDADVLLHAIADAMLGAVALGDIGQHFPPTDAKWKDASSVDMLGLVRSMLAGLGAKVVNVDATVVAERPRVIGRRDDMRVAIAKALKLGIGQISVKATTNEGLDSIGKDQAISAYAIVTVEIG